MIRIAPEKPEFNFELFICNRTFEAQYLKNGKEVIVVRVVNIVPFDIS